VTRPRSAFLRRRYRRHPALRIARIVAGVLLIGLSPLSVFVPMVTGFVMVFAGLSLLSPESLLARRCLMSTRLRIRAWRRARRRREA
jgi:hypothetical protein